MRDVPRVCVSGTFGVFIVDLLDEDKDDDTVALYMAGYTN